MCFNRTTISRDGDQVAQWDNDYTIAFIYPNELDLLLERQGFKIEARYGGAEMTPYAPTADDFQPQFVVAKIEP